MDEIRMGLAHLRAMLWSAGRACSRPDLREGRRHHKQLCKKQRKVKDGRPCRTAGKAFGGALSQGARRTKKRLRPHGQQPQKIGVEGET